MKQFPIRPHQLWSTLKGLTKEIFIVAIGVGITFWISDIIESRQRKSDIVVTLELVKQELELNRNIADSSLKTINNIIQGFSFIHRNQKSIDTLNSDTLLFYLGKTLSWQKGSMRSYALDVLKDNAHYQELSNALLIYLNSVYGSCDTYMENRNRYFNTCIEIFEESNHRISTIEMKATQKDVTGQDIYKVLMGIPRYRALYSNSRVSFVIRQETRNIIKEIDQCINKLDSVIRFDGYENFELSQP